MKLKFGLRARFIIIFLITAALLSFAATYITKQRMTKTIWEQYQKSAIETANLAVSFIDGDAFERYADAAADNAALEKDEQYEIIQENLNRIRRTNEASYIYAMQLLSETDGIYIFDTWTDDTPEDDIIPWGARFNYDSVYTEITKPLTTKKTTEEFEVTKGDKYDGVATIYAPILNGSGDVVGVLGVDMALYDIDDRAEAVERNLLNVMIPLILFFLVVLLMVVQRSFINPIRILKAGVEEMRAGNLGVQAPVKGNTEIAEIAKIFNEMSRNIGTHMKEMENLNNGYFKFVPAEIIKALNKTDVTQIHLGDYREITLSVLSMGIRDFRQIASTMDSRDLYSFINRIYQESVSSVEERGGVIGEFYKGGFLAFHQTVCKNILDSAIVICQHFHEVREQMKCQNVNGPNLEIGIGHGTVILGIVGDENRFEKAMLSEQIMAAEHLRDVAWKYRAQILITGMAADQIPDFADRYSSRFIGLMRYKISGETDRIYDVYDGDSPEERQLKMMTKSIFEEGVNKFLNKQFFEARLCFIEVLKVYQSDSAAREYLFLCDSRYKNQGTGTEADIYIEVC